MRQTDPHPPVEDPAGTDQVRRSRRGGVEGGGAQREPGRPLIYWVAVTLIKTALSLDGFLGAPASFAECIRLRRQKPYV